MALTVDVSKKVEELRSILLHYGGMPSQSEDKAAYTNIKYYIQNHSEIPEIKALIEDFNLSIKKYNKDKDRQFEEIKTILEERKSMPHSSKEKALYGYVKDFFKKCKDDPEVEKIKYQYVGPSCFPLPDSETGSKQTEWDYSGKWKHKKVNLPFDYIEYVWNRFGVLPADNTKPMQDVMNIIHIFCRYIGKKTSHEEQECLFNFSKKMEELGCDDRRILGFHNCSEFDTDKVQENIRELLIENGACAVKYISEMAIPHVKLPPEYIYYYYYIHAYYSEDYYPNAFSPKMPLGRIYVQENDFNHDKGILYVNYRDYQKCDVDKIRANAQANYRNWIETPPASLDEWKAFGQCCFFVPDTDKNRWDDIDKKLPFIDWEETTVQHAFNTSIPYFYLYPAYKYKDFFVYLIEHDYEITMKESRYFCGYKSMAEDPAIAKLLESKNIKLE